MIRSLMLGNILGLTFSIVCTLLFGAFAAAADWRHLLKALRAERESLVSGVYHAKGKEKFSSDKTVRDTAGDVREVGVERSL